MCESKTSFGLRREAIEQNVRKCSQLKGFDTNTVKSDEKLFIHWLLSEYVLYALYSSLPQASAF